MADTSEDFIYVRERRLPYETFDADNHLYENQDALTKFLPKEYEGVIKYVDVNGRTKLAIRDKISEYIPNPTFSKVAVPGGYGRDVTKNGPTAATAAGTGVKPRRCPASTPSSIPSPAYALMKDMGIDRTLLWPTLASVLEERVADDPDVAVAVIHALNEWMHEHWTLRVLRLDLLHADHQPRRRPRAGPRGARVHPRAGRQDLPASGSPRCRRGRAASRSPCPSSTRSGAGRRTSTSSSACTRATPATCRYLNEWDGIGSDPLPFKQPGSPGLPEAGVGEEPGAGRRGLDHRPRPGDPLPEAEVHARRVRADVDPAVRRTASQAAYEESPVLFDEDPFEVFKRNIYVHAFHEPDPKGLLDLGIPADRLMFGSDFPHPEGMADPLAYSEVVDRPPARTPGADHGRHPRQGPQGRQVRLLSRRQAPTTPCRPRPQTPRLRVRAPARGRALARLVEAAKEVFEECGLPDARISDITARAGVSYGSFYHYFDSKEAAVPRGRRRRRRPPDRAVPRGDLRARLGRRRRRTACARASGGISRATATKPACWVSSSRPRRWTMRSTRSRRSGTGKPAQIAESIRQLQTTGPRRPRARPGHRRRRPRLHDLPLRRAVARPGRRRLRLRCRRRHRHPPVRERPGSGARFVITVKRA